jgi:drug/metabolite transporter (DMT)-like permease
VFTSRSNSAIATGLFCCILIWGANNTGMKYLVREWPPVWIACSRMWCVGAVFYVLLRQTDWFGPRHPLRPELRRSLWHRSSPSLAVYVVAFTVALKFTSATGAVICWLWAPASSGLSMVATAASWRRR